MRVMLQPLLLTPFLVVGWCWPAQAQEAGGSAVAGSVEARLQARDLRYEVDPDGDYKIVLSWQKEGRSQLVFVSGTVDRVEDLAIRQVFAPAASLDGGKLDPETTSALLRDNARRILGHWAVNDSHLLYVVNVPDDIEAAGLATAINFAAETADGKELELSGEEDAF